MVSENKFVKVDNVDGLMYYSKLVAEADTMASWQQEQERIKQVQQLSVADMIEQNHDMELIEDEVIEEPN